MDGVSLKNMGNKNHAFKQALEKVSQSKTERERDTDVLICHSGKNTDVADNINDTVTLSQSWSWPI